MKTPNPRWQETRNISAVSTLCFLQFPILFLNYLYNKTENAERKGKNSYQRVQIESKYFTNQDHLFSYWMLISGSSSNNERIVDIHPSKLYMRIWFWHRWKFLPRHPIKHINIAIHNLHKQNIGSRWEAITNTNKIVRYLNWFWSQVLTQNINYGSAWRAITKINRIK